MLHKNTITSSTNHLNKDSHLHRAQTYPQEPSGIVQVPEGTTPSVIKDTFPSQLGSKIEDFEHVKTCSHSQLSIHQQQACRIELSLKQDRDFVEKKKLQRSSANELVLQLEKERGEKSKECVGQYLEGEDLNSKGMNINQHQIQQISSYNKDGQDPKASQRTISIPSIIANPSPTGHSACLNSLQTLKDLDKEGVNLSSKRFYLEDLTTKHNLQDLQNKSSCSSENQARINEIWDTSEYQLNGIDGLKEKQVYSSSYESEKQAEEFEPSCSRDVLKSRYVKLSKQHTELCLEHDRLKKQAELLGQRAKIEEQKRKEYELERQLNHEKCEELELENRELNDLILQYKRQAYNNELTISALNKTISGLHGQIGNLEVELALAHRKVDKAEEELVHLAAALSDKNAEIGEYLQVNQQLQDLMRRQGREHEEQAGQLMRQIVQLRESIEFYKQRLEQEGFTFNLQEIKRIKEILQCQLDEQNKVVTSLSHTYQRSLAFLQEQNNLYASQLSQINRPKEEPNSHYKNSYLQLQSSTLHIISQYDQELEARDSQILTLKQQLFEQQQCKEEVNFNSCRAYIARVDRLTDAILKQKIQKQTSSSLVIQFVYVVDKVCRMFLMSERQNEGLKRENKRLGQVFQQQDRLFNDEFERMNRGLLTQAKNHQLAQRIKEDRKRQQLKLNKPNGNRLSLQAPAKDGQYSESQQAAIQDQAGKREQPEVRKRTLKSLLDHNCLNYSEKTQLSIALLSFARQQLTQGKRLKTLKPSQIYVRFEYGKFTLEATNDQQKPQDQQKSLIFCAPEVLLGFAQSEHSYVWTIGLIIDALFHSGIFFRKINEVTSRTENYYCRSQQFEFREVLESMIKKKQKERCGIQWAFAEMAKLGQGE